MVLKEWSYQGVGELTAKDAAGACSISQ